ncbi:MULTISPECIES: hypothetical protein [unclassified Candidatus Cardinium]|uniref:hypothetical protein n=1 Tax=unclassified Candidatus Cardinium TaxID=2641185 RepID=UPI001FB567F6|nr:MULTISPECIES: hypothetical protein [unclassified Candidatus Cardinium]
MKTKKTYTRCRVGLFIGLLSFHTLSSCVNIGRRLGIACLESEEAKQKKKKENNFHKKIKQAQEQNLLNHQPTKKDPNYNFVKEPWYKSKLGITALVLGTTTFLSIGTAWLYLWSSETNPVLQEGLIRNYIGNGTTTEVMNNVSTTVSSIGNTIKDLVAPGMVALINGTAAVAAAKGLSNLNKWNVSDNSGTVTLPSIDLDKLDKLYGGNMSIDCSPFKIDDPDALDKEVALDIEANNFSVNSMKCKFSQGLHIDATDTHGTTLLMGVSGLHNLPSVEFLVAEGANVHAQDKVKGSTPLLYALSGKSLDQAQAQATVDHLVQHGASPCVKNTDNRPSYHDIKPFMSNKKLLQDYKKCS